ncbi:MULTISPECIES: curli assembly protein CsgF [Falsihalocynthiibacter]|uniref:curli assembly protein CsgF n=1 Tax=Falsihalocynthiibacter TaxID=2854182 RepID=UPI0030010B0A
MKSISFVVAAMFVTASPAIGSEITYQPVNPSFGGSPLNSSHLIATATAQRDATARNANQNSGTSGTETDTSSSQADLFVRQLEGRLLSALAGQVTEAIFGDTGSEGGSITFGSTQVTYERTPETIRLLITDSLDGTVTEIIVPQLLTDS